MSIPVFSARLNCDAEPDLDLRRGLSRELLIRDIQRGRSPMECASNFNRNLIMENLIDHDDDYDDDYDYD